MNAVLISLAVVLLVVAFFIGGAGIYGLTRGEKVPGWVTIGIAVLIVAAAVVILS